MLSNLDLVRSIFAEWGGEHFISSWAQSNRIAEWDPDIEFVVADGPTAGSFRGVAAMQQSVRSMLGAWEDYRGEVEEFRELDDERVLVLDRRGGRGKASGVDVALMCSGGADNPPPEVCQALPMSSANVDGRVVRFSLATNHGVSGARCTPGACRCARLGRCRRTWRSSSDS